MHVTPLEIGLTVAAVFIIFGPKRSPKSNTVTTANIFYNDEKPIVPAYYAAGRAPSPLTVAVTGRALDKSKHQFAMVDSSGSSAESMPAPLPHEFYWT